MKKRNRTLVLVAGLCIILAFPSFVDASSYVVYDSATKTVTVAPTGVDDTANIQAAFDWAVVQGSGATVQLTEGNFYIQSIVVPGFDGTFKGAGEHSTVIDTLRGIDSGADPVPVYVGIDDRGNVLARGPTLFVFEGGGDITIRDVGFDITHPEPGVLDDYIHGLLTTTVSTILITKRSPDLYSNDKEIIVEHVRIDGTISPDGFSNILDGISVGGMTHPDASHPSDRRWSSNPFTATARVSDCTINLVRQSITISLVNGKATIERNVFLDTNIGIITAFLDNSDVEIRRNCVETLAVGIWALQTRGGPTWPGEYPAPPSAPARVSIVDNTVRCFGVSDGIGLTDYMGSGLRAVVSQNKVFLNDNFWGGIWGEGLTDAVITNNQIRGIGMSGIYIFESSGCMLLGNNLQHVDATTNPWWLSYFPDLYPAPITLFGCAYFTVVGGPTQTNVLDIWGYENTFIGLNNMQGSAPGLDIADALEMKREMMGPFLGP